MTTTDLASQIANRMDHARVFADHQEVIFIAHSMGGIMTQKILLTYRDRALAQKVHSIFLYGTPLEGSSIANWAKFFKSDPLVRELQHGDNNFTLQAMNTDWIHANFGQIKRYCAYEVLPEKGFKVVDRYSATRGCDDTMPISTDHHHLVEPANRESDAYFFITDRLNAIPAKPSSLDQPVSVRPILPPQMARPDLPKNSGAPVVAMPGACPKGGELAKGWKLITVARGTQFGLEDVIDESRLNSQALIQELQSQPDSHVYTEVSEELKSEVARLLGDVRSIRNGTYNAKKDKVTYGGETKEIEGEVYEHIAFSFGDQYITWTYELNGKHGRIGPLASPDGPIALAELSADSHEAIKDISLSVNLHVDKRCIQAISALVQPH